jgi:hypothetical protein
MTGYIQVHTRNTHKNKKTTPNKIKTIKNHKKPLIWVLFNKNITIWFIHLTGMMLSSPRDNALKSNNDNSYWAIQLNFFIYSFF